MKKVSMYIGPVRYKSWFKYDNRKFVIDVDQNILFYIFPFLIYIIPLKCYEIESDEKFVKKGFKTMKSMGGVATVGLTGATTEAISKALTINVSILPIIPISIGVIVAIIVIIILKDDDMPGKVKRMYKVRVLPGGLYEELFKILMYFISIITVFLLMYILCQEPNNLFWFIALVLLTLAVLCCPQITLSGRMRVKFIKVID